MSDVVSVRGTVVRVKHAREDSGWRLLTVNVDGQHQTWVGIMPAVAPDEAIEATGKYDEHDKWGRQFQVTTCMPVIPTTTTGLARYLGNGFLPGIGPTIAKNIVDKFGERTMAILDSDPGRLAEVRGVTEAKAKKLGAAWAEKRAVAVIMAFLQQYGASPSLANRIYATYRERAVEVVQKAPYQLAADVDGIGFKIADTIARSIGITAESEERAQAAVMHALKEEAKRGHVFTERRNLARLTVDLLVDQEAPEDERAHYAGIVLRGIDTLAGAKRVRQEPLDEEHVAVFSGALYRAEARLAHQLRAILAARPAVVKDAPKLPMDALAEQAISEFETEKRMRLAPEQREAVMLCAREKVLVITGGPGCGKTTLLLAILRLFDKAKLDTALAAPTGRAAKRMAETTGKPATTIHRLLEFKPGVGFTRNAEKPLEATAVALDEASMLDVSLADQLVQAIGLGARVVFVGDVDQLPSVGPGAVLRDIIESGAVPTVRLNRIFRQAEGSLITTNAHRINHGEKPVDAGDPLGEFQIVTIADDQSAADAVVYAATRWIPERFGLDPMTQVQVLCPMHKGPAGVGELNKRLQTELNGQGEACGRFRAGDKVMQLKNDYERDVFNGDVGYVVGTNEEDDLLVNFDGRDVIYETKHLEQIVVAYATTIHKCVHPDTLVESEEGLLPISRIAEAGAIATPVGVRPYGDKVVNASAPMLRIVTRDGYSLTVTPDHGVDVWDGTNYARVEASSIAEGDIVRLKLGRTIEPTNPVVLPDSPPLDVRAKRYVLPTKMTTDLAEWLGLMVADGTVFRRGFRLLKRHHDVAVRFRDLCVTLFGVSPANVPAPNATCFEVRSTQLAGWCLRIGGLAPNAKAVPECILRSGIDIHAAFLRGLFEDGSVHMRDGALDHVEWSSAYPTMVQTVRTMLLRLGIISGTVRNRHERIEVYGQNARRFAESVGFVAAAKIDRSRADTAEAESKYFVPVSAVELDVLRMAHDDVFSALDKSNSARSMRLSRRLAQMACSSTAVTPVLDAVRERLGWHHTTVTGVLQTEGPSMCVVVPDGHRFLQNGFSAWNSQGSEHQAVVVPLLRSHYVMLVRNLVYTGVTRGKRLVVLVADQRALATAVRQTKRDIRRTRLAHRLGASGQHPSVARAGAADVLRAIQACLPEQSRRDRADRRLV